MHISSLLGAAVLCAGIGLFYTSANSGNAGNGPDRPDGPDGVTAFPPPTTGHFVLVIEGDRDQLSITHASHKADPWAGVQKGLRSDWVLSILDAKGNELSVVPLDMSKFDLAPERKGQPLRVEGCVVSDTRVAMLANAPSFATTTTYVFTRGETIVGTIDATTVNQLAGVGR